MAEGREKSEWNRTAQMLTFLAEPHRDRKKRSRPFAPADFHPYITQSKRTVIPADEIDGFAVLKATFDKGGL